MGDREEWEDWAVKGRLRPYSLFTIHYSLSPKLILSNSLLSSCFLNRRGDGGGDALVEDRGDDVFAIEFVGVDERRDRFSGFETHIDGNLVSTTIDRTAKDTREG